MAKLLAGPGHVKLAPTPAPQAEQIPPQAYSAVRRVGAFGFHACLILLAFALFGLRDLNVAALTLAGAAGFGFAWLFGAIEVRLILLDEALKRVAPQ